MNSKFDLSNLGEKIRYLRMLQHMSQAELAEKLGTKQQVIFNWEKGLRNPKPDTLKRIAIALNLPADIFYCPISENDTIEDILRKLETYHDFMDEIDSGHSESFKEEIESERLNCLIKSLNSEGQKKLLDLAEMLASHPDYSLDPDRFKSKN